MAVAAENSEVLTLRLLLAHWPDDEYILRGVLVNFGEDTVVAVRNKLDKRRVALEAELVKLDRSSHTR